MDGRKHFVADAFVDASGDANLAMLSGESYRVGDGEGKLQALTLPIRIGGLSPGLEIDRCRLQQAIAEYNVSGRFPIARTDGGIIIRLPLSRDMWWMVVDLALNNLGSESFTRAEMAGRAMAHEYLALLKRSVPGFENAYLVATGPQVGIRETRHPHARYMLTRADVTSGRHCAQAVARAAWPIELHGDAGKPIYTPVGGRGYFHVPYDAIRSVSLDNLWYGGRVIGASPEAYGSIRVMGTALATGQAAGIAAADYAGNHQRTDIARIQKRLREQHAIL